MHSAQRARALDRLSSPRGVIAGAACDHRDSLQAVLAKRGLQLDAAGITELKLRVAAALAPAATMILLDAEYSAAQAVAAGAVPGATGARRAARGDGLRRRGQGRADDVPGRLVAGEGPPPGRVGGEAAPALPRRRGRPGRPPGGRRAHGGGWLPRGRARADRGADRVPPRGRGGGRRRPLRRARGRRRPPPRAAGAGRAQAAVPRLGRRLRGADRGLRRADPVGAARRRRERGRDRRPDRGRLPGGIERLHRRAHALRRRRSSPTRTSRGTRSRRTRGRCSSGSPRSPSAWP